MAELTIAGGARAGPGAAPGPAAAFLAGLAEGWRAWCRYRELRGTGDAGLARLGLTRADLARHALLGEPGTPPPAGPVRRSR